MLADCWLVGCLVFLYFKIETKMTELTCLDWLHGCRLPSLLSWSVVGWLVLAKRLTECLADCWLVGGWVFFDSKIETKNWLTCLDLLTDCMAGGSLLCLAGRWLVNWFWQRDWQNVGWLLVGGLLGVFFTSKSRLKWLTCLDWLHGWRLPSLLSWSVVGWSVLAKRLTECGWLLVGGWLGALWRQHPDSNHWLVLTDCMAGGSPLCLAGRWLVDRFWQRDWQNVADCWLVGGLVLCDVKIETKMTDLSWLTAWLAAPLFA